MAVSNFPEKNRKEVLTIADAIVRNYSVCEINRNMLLMKLNHWFDQNSSMSLSILLAFLLERIPRKKSDPYSLPEILEKLWNAEPT